MRKIFGANSVTIGTIGTTVKTVMAGNVGIGLTAPTAVLDVNGAAKIRGTLDLSTNNITNANQISATTNLVLQPTTGNVGIGTSAPGYTLDVSGGIRATSNILGLNIPIVIRAWPYNPPCVTFYSDYGYALNSMEFVIGESSWDLNAYMYIIRFSYQMPYGGNGGGTTNYLHYTINNTVESTDYQGRNLMSYHNTNPSASGAYSNAQNATSRLIYSPNSLGLLSMGEVKVRRYAHKLGTSNISRISVQAYHENSYAASNGNMESFEGGTYESEYYITNWSTFSLTSFKLWSYKTSIFGCDASGNQTNFTCSITKTPL